MARNFQLSVTTTAEAQYHPPSLFFFGSARRFGGIDDATVNAVSAAAAPAKRKALYSQMNDFVLAQSLDMVIGQTQRVFVFFTDKVKGLARTVNQVTVYREAWLA